MFNFIKTFISTRFVHIGYGAASFGAAALHNLFITYYIQLFLSVYQVDMVWFYGGQTVYLIWNSINDPLFGWLLHSSALFHNDNALARIKRLTSVIEYGGYCWIVALLFIFFPLTPFELTVAQQPTPSATWVGLHFVLSICLYDGLLSLVMLTHGALMADFCVLDSDRAALNSASAIGSLLGSLSLVFSHIYWDRNDLSGFRQYLYLVGIAAAMSFRLSGAVFSRLARSDLVVSGVHEQLEDESLKKKKPNLLFEIKKYWSQLKGHRNFWYFVVIVWIQVLNCHFNNNFISTFVDLFIPAAASFIKSSVLSLSGSLPHFTVIACSWWLNQPGASVYHLMGSLYRLKLLLAIVALVAYWLSGFDPHWIFFALLIIVLKVSNETVCRHGGLVLADLVDEDMVNHNRSISSSTLIFGVNALFTKSAQSFAPMLTWPYLLHTQHAKSSAFYLLISVPFVVACFQLFLWKSFTLHGSKLDKIKSIRDELQKSTQEF